MSHPECFGREYFDAAGGECPHVDCLVRYSCKQVFSMAIGILSREQAVGTAESVVSPVVPKRSGPRKKRSGYFKPGRLLYMDEGTLRDQIIFEIREYLEDLGYSTKATKCLHSFIGDDKRFVLKADTRRKNSVLLYVGDGLCTALVNEGLPERPLFVSERPNFPEYLKYVVTLQGKGDTLRFQTAFERFLSGIGS